MGDLRTQKTYDSLINAFLELLEKCRFEDITVIQLCEKAKIRRATFYSHFADKFEFLSFFIQEIRKEFLANAAEREEKAKQEFQISEKATGKKNVFYDVLFHELIVFFSEHPLLVQNIQNSQMLPTMMEIFVDDVQQYVYGYLQRSYQQADAELLQMKAHFYAGGVIQLIKAWMKEPDRYAVDQIDWLEFLL